MYWLVECVYSQEMLLAIRKGKFKIGSVPIEELRKLKLVDVHGQTVKLGRIIIVIIIILVSCSRRLAVAAAAIGGTKNVYCCER